MSSAPTLWSFIANAGWVVKFVLLILLAASLISWTIIFQRISLIKKFRKIANDFEQRFWSGIDLNQLFNELNNNPNPPTGLDNVFLVGFREFKKLYQKPNIHINTLLDSTQRAMRTTATREIENLEQPISFLATVGSTSPYVGLFGTVWGIMTSFQTIGLGQAQQATLAMVAPGISEALIATAVGLFAAIPAVIAYNRLTHSLDGLTSQYENFQEEFTTILTHQIESK